MAAPATAPRVGIAGLGLIGGSLALALKEARFAVALHAWDPDPDALQRGLDAGVIDAPAADLACLADAVDVLVLAAPTQACDALLRDLISRPLQPRCVTDVASVKAPLCALADAADAAFARRFVGGHPIAGSERSGVGAARSDLFRDHRVILTPGRATEAAAVHQVRAMWLAAGAAVSEMDVEEHDALLAATSHLPHVLAFALVDALARSPRRADIFRFAAGGFRDFTRIASSDPVMWRDISLANRDALLAALDDFTAHLGRLRSAIEAGDRDAIEGVYRDAKAARDEYLQNEVPAARGQRGGGGSGRNAQA